MKYTLYALGVLALAASGSAKQKAETAPLHGIELSGDNAVSVKVNGIPARLIVEPSIGGIRAVNPEIAEKAELKMGKMGMAFFTYIGPVRIMAKSDRAQVDYGMLQAKDRVLWPDRQITTKADGVVGPAGIPFEKVSFRLAPTKQGEKSIAFPMESLGLFDFKAPATLLNLGGQEIRVTFTLFREEALATAPTGNLIARALKGRLASEVAPMIINYDIARPVSRLAVEKPLTIGGRTVDKLFVRVSDFGDATKISGQDEPPVDRDEIVVEAKKGKKQRHELVLGRAFLKGCSTLTYDFPNKKILLSCT